MHDNDDKLTCLLFLSVYLGIKQCIFLFIILFIYLFILFSYVFQKVTELGANICKHLPLTKVRKKLKVTRVQYGWYSQSDNGRMFHDIIRSKMTSVVDFVISEIPFTCQLFVSQTLYKLIKQWCNFHLVSQHLFQYLRCTRIFMSLLDVGIRLIIAGTYFCPDPVCKNM